MRTGLLVFLTAVSAIVAGGSCGDDPAALAPPPLPDHRNVGFHGDRRKLGWVEAELGLPRRFVSAGVGVAWESASFDSVKIAGRTYPPLVYASPLFVRDVPTQAGTSDVVYVATSNGFVYAVATPASVVTTDPAAVRPGAFLFRAKLLTPSVIPSLDGGVPLGILSTPVLDVNAMRLYVVGHDSDLGWRAYALDATNGRVLPGWPLTIDETAMGGVNVNGPALFSSKGEATQRSALALSPSGDRLYVAFGSSPSGGPGWIAAIHTAIAGSVTPKIARSFSSAPSLEPTSNGGIWAAGGPVVDPSGRLWVTTGSSPPGTKDASNVWGSSLLVLDRDLGIEATYTPYNYCKLDESGLDLAASAPILLPKLSAAQTSTPLLVAFGSTQGNVYLLDRNRLQPRADRRPPCGVDPERDLSLLPPVPQVRLRGRGPLNVFGPFSDEIGGVDVAKMRSRPAYFRDGVGKHWLFVSGSYKAAVDSTIPVPPGIAKLRIVLAHDKPAHLESAVVNDSVVLKNPGSPVVTGENDDAVVWVLDENVQPSRSLLDRDAPTSVLYAFAARDLQLLWKSSEGDLRRTGRYGVPAIGNGKIYVASDKLTAFAPR